MIQEALNEVKTNWKNILETCLSNSQSEDINKFLKDESATFTVYPPIKNIFNAFNFFDFEELEIIIIGQDPYHGPNQANGLCFSVNDGIKIPPSLINIFKEIHNNMGIPYKLPKSGNLEHWANQKILMLNKTLTVRESKPNSHIQYWHNFTRNIIEHILYHTDNKIFVLWGNNAKSIKKNIPQQILNKHIFLESTHPSPLSANRGGFFGCNHFSKINTILEKENKKIINWLK